MVLKLLEHGLSTRRHFVLLYSLLIGDLHLRCVGGDDPSVLGAMLLRALPEREWRHATRAARTRGTSAGQRCPCPRGHVSRERASCLARAPHPPPLPRALAATCSRASCTCSRCSTRPW